LSLEARTLKPIVIGILCIAVVSFPARGGEHDLEMGVSLARSDGREFFDDIAADHGASVSANWYFSRRLSAGLTVARFETAIYQSGVFGQRTGSMRWYPMVLSGHVHFRPDGKFHPYLGAGLSYALSDSSVAGFSVHERLTLAPGAGATFDLDSKWRLSADAKWLRLEGANNGGHWSANQVMTSAGVRFRFSR
jgi:outer membrane protein